MKVENHDIDFDQPEIDAIPVGTFLYTAPPQRTWVGLKSKETTGCTQHEMSVVKDVSKVLMEKNG